MRQGTGLPCSAMTTGRPCRTVCTSYRLASRSAAATSNRSIPGFAMSTKPSTAPVPGASLNSLQ
jgi:hypothetical protein